MTLLTIAEVLAGELLVSPGGLVDRVTAKGEEPLIWQQLLLSVEQSAGAAAAHPEALVAV